MRPTDFRKEINRVYSFRLDDDQAVLRLTPRAELRDNPRNLGLDVSSRTAVITHAHRGYVTLIRY